jgi:hypothetical protein
MAQIEKGGDHRHRKSTAVNAINIRRTISLAMCKAALEADSAVEQIGNRPGLWLPDSVEGEAYDTGYLCGVRATLSTIIQTLDKTISVEDCGKRLEDYVALHKVAWKPLYKPNDPDDPDDLPF